MFRTRCSLALLSLLALLVAACGDGGETVDTRDKGFGVSSGVVGTVRFEKRRLSGDGVLSGQSDVDQLPARWVRVEVVEDRGGGDYRLISSTVTDGEGRYGVGGVFPESFRVLVYPDSPVDSDAALPVRVLDHDSLAFAVASSAMPAVAEGDLVTVDVLASAGGLERLAGAFNIVDVVQRAGDLWQQASGIPPDPVTVHWESGGWNQPSTSYFDPATGRISVLGGQGRGQDFTDTDEFDDSVVAHEFMHFLMWAHSQSSSPGGAHGGEDLVPNLAFDEGIADWFGTLTTGASLYQDTIGTADGLPVCGYCDDLERSTQRVVEGVGSEQSIYELLWDLTDGSADAPDDQDGDGVAVAAADVIRIVSEFDPAADYPYVMTVLERVVGRGLATEETVDALLRSPVDHDLEFPVVDREVPSSGRDVFPIPIAVGQSIEGFVDSITVPATGLNVERGFDSIRYYRLDLSGPRRVTITLRMLDGTGVAPNDLDLHLLSLTNTLLRVAESENPEEAITVDLGAGSYILAVYSFYERDRLIQGVSGAQGSTARNRARYTLEVSG